MKILCIIFSLFSSMLYAINDSENIIKNSSNSMIVGRDYISLNFNTNKTSYNYENTQVSNYTTIKNITIQKHSSTLLPKIKDNFKNGINKLDQKLTKNKKEILEELYNLFKENSILKEEQLKVFKLLLENNQISKDIHRMVADMHGNREARNQVKAILNPKCKENDINEVSDIIINIQVLNTDKEKNKLRCLKQIYKDYQETHIIEITGYNSFENTDRVVDKIIEISEISISNLSSSYTPKDSDLEKHTVYLDLILRD